jgi:predicted TIM-barrel fold metal-dependent hydrolase
MGRLDLERPESRTALAGWRRQPGMLGLRFTFHTPISRAWLTDGTADWLWREAERAGLPVMIFTPGSLPAVARIAERHPGLRLVIDHLALVNDAVDAAAFADLPALLALARHDNVAVKATSLPSYSSEPYPHPGLHEPIRRVVDAFGPRRVFWGSDVTRLPGSYRQCVTLFTEALPWLGESDKEWIMGRGVATWLGWPLPGEPGSSP